MSACRSCKAPIEWVKFAATGRPVPLDIGEVKGGNLVVVNGFAHPYRMVDSMAGRPARRAHFATCPDADAWRGQ